MSEGNFEKVRRDQYLINRSKSLTLSTHLITLSYLNTQLIKLSSGSSKLVCIFISERQILDLMVIFFTSIYFFYTDYALFTSFTRHNQSQNKN
jgi:hypothetical protein